jgi:Ca2+-binding RTX toxin-like protein
MRSDLPVAAINRSWPPRQPQGAKMTYYIITGANSINDTVSSQVTSARDVNAGDNLLVDQGGYVIATGADTPGVLVNAYATGSLVTVNGLVMGTSDGINSFGQYAEITVNGKVIGGQTGIDISNSGKVFVSDTGVVSGDMGMSVMGGATLINDGEVVGIGSEGIQLDQGTITNNGVISSGYLGIFFNGSGSSSITNSGSIFGGLETWSGANDPDVFLDIDNSGEWHGTIDLTVGADTVKNTGKIIGDIFLEGGDDVLDSRNGLISGTISAGAGNDTVLAGAADDTIDGGAGADTIDGGGGRNTISYESSAHGVSINLLAGTAKYGDAAGDQLTHIQNVTGTLHDDVLVGDNSDNVISGMLGKDVLTGNGGNDSFVMLGTGNAIIDGGSGNDHIRLKTVGAQAYGYAFSADNRINGGSGYDTLDLVNTGTVVLKNHTLENVEKIVVEDGYDYGLTTVDSTVAKGKSLEIEAGSLTSTHKIIFNGGAETDGRFLFNGGDGNDTFKGGAGNDVIAGNAGADVLRGGGGADTFVFNTFSDSLFGAHDKVTDFKAGLDKFQFDVDVTGIDAKVSGSVSTAADLTSLLAGHLDADHAILVKVDGGALKGHTLMVVDADATDGYLDSADYVVDVKGMHGALSAGDFVF